jgi:hypothetical protein
MFDDNGVCRVFRNPNEGSDPFETGATTEEGRKFVAKKIADKFKLKVAKPIQGNDYKEVRLVAKSKL